MTDPKELLRRHEATEWTDLEEWRDALSAALERAEKAETAERNLSNLLARIHRDGGQYEQEHGTMGACVDAEFKVAHWLADLNDMENALAELRALATKGGDNG